MMQIQFDTKTIITATAVVGALIALGGYGTQGIKAAVTYVGGKETPYASEKEEMQVAADVKSVKQSQPAILWQLLQDDADNCDNRTTVQNLEARATHNQALQKEADKNDKRCDKLHDQADGARRALFPH
jgi:hypothetical protein